MVRDKVDRMTTLLQLLFSARSILKCCSLSITGTAAYAYGNLPDLLS